MADFSSLAPEPQQAPQQQPMQQARDFSSLAPTPAQQQHASISDLLNGIARSSVTAGKILNSAENSNFAKTFANDNSLNATLGAGDSIRNLMASAANVMPGVKVPMEKSSSGMAYSAGKLAGDIGGFAGLGEIADTARLGSEAIPYLGKISQYLGGNGAAGIARRGLGAAGYGAIENPDNRGLGAIEGGVGAPLLETGIPLAAKAVSSIRPNSFMNKIYQQVPDLLAKAKSESKELYGSLMDKAGGNPVAVSDLDDETFKTRSGLKKLFNEYKKTPTVNNAHRLQSQLGSESSSLTGTDVATGDRKNAYNDARQSLLDGIVESLGGKNSEHAKQYAQATQHYMENVIPLRMTKKVLQKITQKTPEKVATALEAVTKRDAYPKYISGNDEIPRVPKSVSDLQDALHAKIRNRNIAQMLAGAAAGGTAAHSLGIPIGAEIGAAAGGVAPYKLREMLASSGTTKVSKKIPKAISNLYPSAKSAGIKAILSEALSKKQPLEITINKPKQGANP